MANEMYVDNPATASEPAFGVAAKAFSVNYLKALYSERKAWKYLKNFDADVASFGESVAFPSFPSLTAADVTSSTGAFTPNTTSITQASIAINKQKIVGYSIPEYLLKQAKIDLMSAFAEEAGKAVSDSIDAELVELFPGFSRTGGTANTDLTEALALDCLEKLVEKFVPLSNPKDLVWVLPASQFAPVKVLKGYTSYRLSGGMGTEGGSDVQALVDTLYGIDVAWRNDASLSVSSGKIGGLMHKDAVGVAIQRMPSMMQPVPIPNTINTQLRCYALFGIAEIKDDNAVRVLCK